MPPVVRWRAPGRSVAELGPVLDPPSDLLYNIYSIIYIYLYKSKYTETSQKTPETQPVSNGPLGQTLNKLPSPVAQEAESIHGTLRTW